MKIFIFCQYICWYTMKKHSPVAHMGGHLIVIARSASDEATQRL